MRKIKVLQVTSAPRGIGGVERLLLDMARHWDQSRFIVGYCNLFDEQGGHGPFPTALRATGLPYFEIAENRWYQLPTIVRRLVSLIRDEKIDIVHYHMVHATILGLFVRLFARDTAVVVTKHYTYGLLRKPILKFLDRMSTNRADAVVAVSKRVSEDLVHHGAKAARIRVIHNGTDIELFDRMSAEPTERLARDDADILIGCVGNFLPVKGHRYLIQAMPEIIRNFPAARLVLIGEGRERQELERLARALGLDDAVSIPGFQRNVPAALRQLELLIQPSLKESFGIVILEGMAARKTVVATDVGGIPEVVLDGVTGMLIPPMDPSAIADAVCTLLNDADRRKQMGTAGRERVEREFDIRNTVRSYESLYSELVPGAIQRANQP